tara:strand:- start:404 stop:1747 length:1344 start_codon:yes stop_codon:yes gene_type:complete
MKKITFLFTICIVMQISIYAQGCLPNGIFIDSQLEIDNFQSNYPNCTEIEGSLTINGDDITNLNGLSNITAIGGWVIIASSPYLTSLSGLESLTSIGNFLSITDTSLIDIQALSSLTSVNGHIYISNTLIESLEGLNSLTTVNGSLTIRKNHSLSTLEGLEGLTTLPEDLNISHNNSLMSLIGINALTSVGMDLLITNNPLLPNLEGLEQITSVGGWLSIIQNHLFVNLDELQSLTTVGDKLWILQNNGLENFDGLNNLTSIGGDVEIRLNNKLTDISALSSLTSIGGVLNIEDNFWLTTLDGLDNIDPASIGAIEILNNNFLATCEVQSICDYIGSPGAIIDIDNNSWNCDSKEAVELACQIVNYPELDFSNYYLIYPNPVDNKLHIRTHNNSVINSIIIYNQFGQNVFNIQPNLETIDVSHLNPGLYIIEINNNIGRFRDKLIVQ